MKICRSIFLAASQTSWYRQVGAPFLRDILRLVLLKVSTSCNHILGIIGPRGPFHIAHPRKGLVPQYGQIGNRFLCSTRAWLFFSFLLLLGSTSSAHTLKHLLAETISIGITTFLKLSSPKDHTMDRHKQKPMEMLDLWLPPSIHNDPAQPKYFRATVYQRKTKNTQKYFVFAELEC
jgi:hypothetical protein